MSYPKDKWEYSSVFLGFITPLRSEPFVKVNIISTGA